MTAPPPDQQARRSVELDPAYLPTLVVPFTMVFAAVVAVGASSGYAVSVGCLGALGLVLAWGWPVLLDAPTQRGVRLVLVLGVLLMTATLAATSGPNELRWLPVAVAIGLIAGLVQQLLRTDGRARMTFGVAATVSGLAVVASGAALVPLSVRPLGAGLVHVALAALVTGAVAGLAERRARRRSLAVLVVLVVGALTAWVVAVFVGVKVLTAIGLGMFVAALSYSVRYLLAALPDREGVGAQAAIAAASVLLTGVVIYAVGALAGV